MRHNILMCSLRFCCDHERDKIENIISRGCEPVILTASTCFGMGG